MVSDVGGKRVMLVGDVGDEGWDAEGKEWIGNAVSLTGIHSGIKVFFIDELDKPHPLKKSLLGFFWHPSCRLAHSV
jgi:hypothetical protein